MILFDLSLFLQTTSGIEFGHPSVASEDNTVFTTSCAGKRFHFAYQNRQDRTGIVTSVIMDGREVEGAAAVLSSKAGGRDIEKVALLSCHSESGRYVAQGVMQLDEAASIRLKQPKFASFKIRSAGLTF